ncbi:uncharacterized protein LOC108865017 [Galendromus occidentalis]|uniref:Uncharacterized protein LOC108865017 n=1 Tax=Galendromus occidentalis TaxID=34638 RepID=A0AAJ7L7U6_9ACAR|nr:uncharacterized protein LOC108865017 [Galendromus occidentalis]
MNRRFLRLTSYVKLLGQGVLSTDGHVILREVCERDVAAERKSQVSQHLNGAKHKSLLNKKEQSSSTSLIQIGSFLEVSGKKSQFRLDLCEAFVSAGIPFWKLENSKLTDSLGKSCSEQIPSSLTPRKKYLQSVFEHKLNNIREYIAEEPIWLSMDESTDVTGRFVAHTVVGTLETSGTKSFLLHAETLGKSNSSTIAQHMLNSLAILWPDGIRHDKVLLLVTDGAAYMKKVVANGKKVFRKSAARVNLFREIAPGTTLPPQPILTRWGTWIEAAIYYSANFVAFSSVVAALDENDASSIRVFKDLLESANLRENLAFIEAHFGILPRCIEMLEGKEALLVDSTDIFKKTLLDLRRTPGTVGGKIRRKCDLVLTNNPDFHRLDKVTDILRGNPSEGSIDEYSPSELASLKFAPITSVDVERTFSILKHTLSDRRQTLTFDHLKQHLIVYSNP